MSATFPCPHCGAEYGFDQVDPGTHFTCGACGQDLVAPNAPEPAPARATAAAGPARRSQATAGAKGGARRGAPAARAQAPASAKGRAPAKKKGGLPPAALIGGGAGLVLVVVLIVVLSGGGGGSSGPAGSGTADQAPAEKQLDVAAEFDKVAAKIHGGTARSPKDADAAWGWAAEYRAAAAQVKGPTSSERQLASRLMDEAIKYERESVKLDPDYAAYHEKVGNRKVENDLTKLFEVTWLSEVERSKARKIHERLLKDAEKSNGWIAKEKFKDFDAFMAEIEPKRAAYASVAESPWYKKAEELAAAISKDVAERFEANPNLTFPGFKMFANPPYALFIENDSGWDAKTVAESEAPKLRAVMDYIRAEWSSELTLPEIEGPIPVLYFRDARRYQTYARSPGAAAHFEPDTGRLALNSECDTSTLIHEGTHQVLFSIISHTMGKQANAQTESFWFHEGMAEWYGGSTRRQGENGEWTYAIGGLQFDRMRFLDTSTEEGRKYLFTLREMLELAYGDRGRMQGSQILNVYSQAWFFIWFLNHFNVGQDGMVDLNKPGIYRDQWRKFVKAALLAKGNGVELFKQETGFTDKDLERLEEEYWRFYQFVRKKMSLRQIDERNRRLVPWNEYVNKVGEKTGEREDDLLPPLDRERIPLRTADKPK